MPRGLLHITGTRWETVTISSRHTTTGIQQLRTVQMFANKLMYSVKTSPAQLLAAYAFLAQARNGYAKSVINRYRVRCVRSHTRKGKEWK